MSKRSRYNETKKIENSLKKKSYDELTIMRERIYDEIEEKSERREINLRILSTTIIWGIGIAFMAHFSAFGEGDVGKLIISGASAYFVNKYTTPTIKKEEIKDKLLAKNRKLLKMLDKEINRKRNLEHIFEYDPICNELESDKLLETFFKERDKSKEKTTTIPKVNIPIEESIFAPSTVFQKKTETSKVLSDEEIREKQSKSTIVKPQNKEEISPRIVSPPPESRKAAEEEKQRWIDKRKVAENKINKELKSLTEKKPNSYNASENKSQDEAFDEIMRIFNGIDDENKPKKR